ncbi:MAG: hypothetical protein D6780_00335 [Candidatus Dadabacteria bacterium]|nr:MAG: hypothetical protein D6780_00335 [Candidatus Dadabacteria bacterium]
MVEIEEVLKIGEEILSRGGFFLSEEEIVSHQEYQERIDEAIELIDKYSHKVHQVIDGKEKGEVKGTDEELLLLSKQYEEVVLLAQKLLSSISGAIEQGKERLIELKKRQQVHTAYLRRIGLKIKE